MFKKVLIANRGAIAVRIIRTLKKLGVKSVAVFSEADSDALHTRLADEAVCVGAAPVAESYLRTDAILEAVRATGAEAVHPGYGFLSENAGFAEACERAGVVFIGPTPDQMRLCGLKHTARELAEKVAAPLLPGTGLLASAGDAVRAAREITYPVILKSTAGGGGIGMSVCHDDAEVERAFASIERLSKNNFKDAGIYLEKFIKQARHIEVQIFGDGAGRVLALGERDCSAQRRNQKVIEETPAPGLSQLQRDELAVSAIRLAAAANYRSAGTVEFIFDADTGRFYFLEVNTRLQVEHGVTEEVTGVDLVEWMTRLAAGERAFFDNYAPAPRGHAIQARVYAEDPLKNFAPSCGLLTEAVFGGERIETWVEAGTTVTPFYDPMLAKIIVHGKDRADALAKLDAALAGSAVSGIETNLEYLRGIVAGDVFRAGKMTTGYLARHEHTSAAAEVLEGGAQTTIQDYPGRVGYWDVGVPPSGPMDHLAHRAANALLGNDPADATLEITLLGPTLRFRAPATLALAGADFSATLNDQPLPPWGVFNVAAGDTLALDAVTGTGARAYLAVRGGWQCPKYLGSRATFAQGKFGGHGGRALRIGDVLHFSPQSAAQNPKSGVQRPFAIAAGGHWSIGVLYGPHGAPDYFTDADIAQFFATDWKVHYNSNRTGLRLIGPKPKWARQDGGEAGLHPSNLHDNPYAIGAINFTGDMPIILGPDGPSLGGFVCPCCIVQSEIWKIGQLKNGDTVRFVPLTLAAAEAAERAQDNALDLLRERGAGSGERGDSAGEKSTAGALAALFATVELARDRLQSIAVDSGRKSATPPEPAIELHTPAGSPHSPFEITYRRSGDKYLLVEYGPLVLDIAFRFRVAALMDALRAAGLPGLIDLTPGVRSLQIHYDNRLLPLAELMRALRQIETTLPAADAMTVTSRIVHLPLSWDDAAVTAAIAKYQQSVRADAPWCPSNIEFIRRLNGLPAVEDVRRIAFETSYCVLGLGDVYLGAPAAAPLDPRHRLLTTKYNPARTYTAEGTVGIGGVYMCIYGMDSPGGYQLVGRTVPVWNTWRVTPDFEAGKPWLLRFFDQVRFYPVTGDEILDLRKKFLDGKFTLRTETATLRLGDYRRFLEANADSIAAFRATQQTAFLAERARWQAAEVAAGDVGEAQRSQSPSTAGEAAGATPHSLPAGAKPLRAPLAGNVWKIAAEVGATVHRGDPIIIVEAMKMETPLNAPCDGVLTALYCATGTLVEPGQTLAAITPA
jgi:urea carboxylase